MIKSNKIIKKAFTMAEAILVMTILGIIATIMIANIKPSEFREEAMQIQAKKVMNEIDQTINQMIINDADAGNFFYITAPQNRKCHYLFGGWNPDDGCYEIEDLSSSFLPINSMASLVGQYASISRKKCEDEKCPCFDTSSYNSPFAFYLKDGACFLLSSNVSSEFFTFIPGEESAIKIEREIFYIFFDVNGEQGPNILGKDQYRIPLYSKGLWFDAEAITGKPAGAKCGFDYDCTSGHCMSTTDKNRYTFETGEPWGVCAAENGS